MSKLPSLQLLKMALLLTLDFIPFVLSDNIFKQAILSYLKGLVERRSRDDAELQGLTEVR